MNVNKVIVVFVLFSMVLASLPLEAMAQTPVRKFGRGLANIATGILELPLNIVDAADDEGYIAAVTYGVVKGLAMSVLRIGVGVYETATFIIPLPFHYEPILEPEFLMGEEAY